MVSGKELEAYSLSVSGFRTYANCPELTRFVDEKDPQISYRLLSQICYPTYACNTIAPQLGAATYSSKEVLIMAITFVGYYRPVRTDADVKTWQESGAFAPEFAAKVRAFPSQFPTTCKLIGSWAVTGGQAPGVTVVEAESFDDLQFINAYYAGWLEYDWHPTRTGGPDRS